jgi:hypothetical protein
VSRVRNGPGASYKRSATEELLEDDEHSEGQEPSAPEDDVELDDDDTLHEPDDSRVEVSRPIVAPQRGHTTERRR